MIKAESIREAENIGNVELNKISAWVKENKIGFKECKSKVLLMTSRKRKEQKEVEIYLNNKFNPQLHSLKYLGIIFNNKSTFREHINYMAEKCTSLIFSISKSANLSWGLKYAALKTIYAGRILLLLLYGVPVWMKAIEKGSYKSKLVRVQRLINIESTETCSTVSNEALCILTGLTPIAIKIEAAAQFYQLTRGSTKEEAQTDRDMGVKHWYHPPQKR